MAGRDNVIVAFEEPERRLRRAKRDRNDPPPRHGRGVDKITPPKFAGEPPNWEPDDLGLPGDEGCECPVIPVGHDENFYYLISSTGTFQALKPSDFSHSGIQSLFAAMPNYPQWAWPRHGKVKSGEDGNPMPPPINSFHDDNVRTALFQACARAGLFSPRDKLRGRGAWKLQGGQIAYHAGEEIWVVDNGNFRHLETGVHEGKLYPRMPPLPAPYTRPFSPKDNPAKKVLETFRKWNWERPLIDPLLLLGWVGVAYMGGALDWRSAVLLIGDKGTGKSTLQEGLQALFGDALFHSADTTAAGIYQSMANDTRPVALDELEPDADQRKVSNVVHLMRDASSGAIGRRGGSDGASSEFQMRSAFLFSAINNPLTSAQDLSRVATLRLKPLDPKQSRPDPIDAEITGPMILANLMREWPRFGPTLDAYMGALEKGGHDGRGQKTYGTLLAAAELVLGAEAAADLEVPLSDDLDFWTVNLSADSLPEIEDAKPNWRNCLETLLGAQVEAWRSNARSTVGKCLDDVANHFMRGVDADYSVADARKDLEMTGLGLIEPKHLEAMMEKAAIKAGNEGDGTTSDRMAELLRAMGKEDYGWVLAIPNSSKLVARLFGDTPWASGAWKDALRQCPHVGVTITDKALNRVRINGMQQRCTLVVMKNYHTAPER